MNKFKISIAVILCSAIVFPVKSFYRELDSYDETNYFYVPKNVEIDETTKTGILEIWLDNITEDFSSYQLDLYLPDGFSIAKGRTWNVTPNNGLEANSKTYDHIVTIKQDSEDGYFRIAGLSMTLTTINPNDDLLLSVEIQAPDDYNTSELGAAFIKNIKIAAGRTGEASHIFPDVRFYIGPSEDLYIASGDEEIWNNEWSASSISLPVTFLGSLDNQPVNVTSEDISFEIRPQFEINENEYDEGLDAGYKEISEFEYENSNLNVEFPCSGLYSVWMRVNDGVNYTINGEKTVQIKLANIYPSLDGLLLSYVSMNENGAVKEFMPTDGMIQYTFEIVADDDGNEIPNWYHENPKNPFVKLSATGLNAVWYKLHDVEDIEDLTGKERVAGYRKMQASPENQGYSQASVDDEGNMQIYIAKLAYAGKNAQKDLSFVLSKNNATTPVIDSSVAGGDPKSEQYVTIYKTENTTTELSGIVNDDGEAVYFDINGYPVKTDNLDKGIYIKIQKGKSEKIIL